MKKSQTGKMMTNQIVVGSGTQLCKTIIIIKAGIMLNN